MTRPTSSLLVTALGHRLVPLLFLAWMVGCATTSGVVGEKADDWSIGSLYPLQEGNAWSYVVDTGADSILTTVRVTTVQGQQVLLRSGAEDIAYVQQEDSLARLGGAGAVLQGPITVGASWKSGASSTSRVVRRVERIDVPAGSFTACAEVVDEDAATGKQVTTTYCPGVGPVQVISQLALSTGQARVSARLQGHALAAK